MSEEKITSMDCIDYSINAYLKRPADTGKNVMNLITENSKSLDHWFISQMKEWARVDLRMWIKG